MLIDAACETHIDIVEYGASRCASVFEAILLQLWIKEILGQSSKHRRDIVLDRPASCPCAIRNEVAASRHSRFARI